MTNLHKKIDALQKSKIELEEALTMHKQKIAADLINFKQKAEMLHSQLAKSQTKLKQVT